MPVMVIPLLDVVFVTCHVACRVLYWKWSNLGSGEWRVGWGSGEWRVASGEWGGEVASGEWRVARGEGRKERREVSEDDGE
jgi:hypothetical protein